MSNAEKKGLGKVYICGAGPGDPKLLTVRAAELLKSCKVILYDRLVSDGIISQIPNDTQKIYVGRKVGDPTEHQDKTNDIMVEHARAGRDVLRLKGGDPFVFGRGAEEAEYLREHGIEFEVVPGISSAVASPAYAGIPVTHRSYSSSFIVVTGHEEESKQAGAVHWDRVAGAADTIVVLMGIGQIEQICQDLVAAGRPGGTPVAIIEKGTTQNQHVITGTLDTIASIAKGSAKPPAVIVIGEVVSLHSQIDWFAKGKS